MTGHGAILDFCGSFPDGDGIHDLTARVFKDKPEPTWHRKQELKSPARVGPAGTLPWLGFGRAQPNERLSRGSIVESMHWMVLHRPVEPARLNRWDEKAGLQRDAIRSQ